MTQKGDTVSCLRCKKDYVIEFDMYLCNDCISKKSYNCGIPDKDFMDLEDDTETKLC